MWELKYKAEHLERSKKGLDPNHEGIINYQYFNL